MDITVILSWIFGGTSLAATVTSAIFYKENRTLKKKEVESVSADVDAKTIANDNAQIDLGTKFMEQSLEMTKKMQELMEKNNSERNEQYEKQKDGMHAILEKVSRIEKKVDDLSERTTALEEWGNGELQAYKEQKRKMSDKRYKKIKPELEKV